MPNKAPEMIWSRLRLRLNGIKNRKPPVLMSTRKLSNIEM
jgi:hypothetical protein